MKEDDYWAQHVNVACQLCQEASFVLMPFCGGPPHMGCGGLAQDLINLHEYGAMVTLVEEAVAATTTANPILGLVMEDEVIKSALTAASNAVDIASVPPPPPAAGEPSLDSIVPSLPLSGHTSEWAIM